MNLGLAAQSFFKQNEHLQDRDYLAKQRAYQQQVMDSQAAGLDDQSNAARAKNKLSAAESQAGLDVLPTQTENLQKRQAIDSSNLDYQTEQLPTIQGNATKATQIQGAGLDAGVKQIDENEKNRLSGNATAESARYNKLLSELFPYFKSNDSRGAINYMNAQIPKGSSKVTRIEMGGEIKKNSQGEAIDQRYQRAIKEDGSTVDLPFAAFTQANAAMQTGKYKAIQDADTGRIVTLNENTGDVQERLAGDPERTKAKANGRTPEMQLQFEFLTTGETGPKLSKEDATEMIMKGARKTPEERFHVYQTELIKANKDSVGVNRQTLEQIRKSAIDLSGYDPSKAAGLSNNNVAPTGSNTPNPFTMNPTYQGLFKP